MVTKLGAVDTIGIKSHSEVQDLQRQEFVDANVKHFARTVTAMAANNGFRLKADVTLGATPSVRITVASEQAFRELLADKEHMKMNGLDGALEGEGEALHYRAQTGYLSDGLPIQLEIAEVPNPRRAVFDSPPREYGFQNNIDANGAPRVATTEEFVQSNVLALGRQISSGAANQGIRAQIYKSGPTQLQVSVDSDAKRESMKSLLLEKDFFRLSGFQNSKVEEIPPGLLRFTDGGYLQHGVVIELVVAPPARSVY